MATAALHKMNLSAPDLSAMVPSLPSLDLPGLPTLDLRSSKGHKKHKAMATTSDASHSNSHSQSQSTMAAATSMPDVTTAHMDGSTSAAAASSLGALDRLIPSRSRDGELALLLSSPHPATTTRLPPGVSPVPTSSGAKRRGLRGKVKGALRRMVSNDESVFSRNHLVFRGDNESTTSHLTNIHSTHSGTSIPIQPATAAETSTGASDGGAATQPQHHPRTSDASASAQPAAPRTSSTTSSTTNLPPAPRSPKPPAHSASAASKNLTKKFNASMQYFLSTVNAVAPINLSPKPGNGAAVRKHQQRLASITSTTSLDQLPFEDGDDEADKDSSSSSSSNEEVSRSKSPAMQRRLERRRRKKKRLGQKSHNNSSKAKLEHSSNPRLRRRHKHYRKIKTPTKTTPQTDDEHEQDADKEKDSKTLVAKTNSNSSNNSKGLQKTASARDKPRARSAPRSHSQKMIRVQQEDAAAPLIPGEAFLKCVLDDIHAKKAASGELVIASEDNVTDEDDDQEALLPKGVKKSSHGSSKKGHHSNNKKPIARKKKTKKEPQPETPPKSNNNKGEEAVALLSPEASAHGGGEDNASNKSKPERDEIGEALQASTQHDSDCDKDKDESELPTPKRRTKGAWGAKADPGQDFKSQASSKELGDFDNDDDEGSDNEEGGSDDDDDEEEEEDMPPYLVAMLEPEDSPEHDKAKGKAGGEPEDEGESILLAMAGEDSVAPLVQRSGSELMAEVEKSLKDFDIRKTTTKANNSLQDFMVMAHDLPETPSALTESIDPSELLQKEDSFKMTPDFKFSFSNVVVAKKADGSPSSLDDTAVLDIKAKVEKKKKLRRPTGMVRGQSLSDLGLQRDPKPAHNISNDNNKTTLEDLLEGTDFFDELLNSLMTAPTKPASEPSSPDPPKVPVRRDTLKLDRNELPLADTSIGSGSRRGRSRSTRKRSSTTNGAPTRNGRSSTTTKMKDGNGRVATDGSSRRKAQRKHNLKQNSDSHLIGAKTRQRSKSSSKHLARSESQLPEARERSKSHSRRDDPARRSKGGRREGSRRRMSLGGSEKKHESKEERERSRSTSKESRQSGEVKTTTKDRDRSTSKESRESGQVKTTRDRDRSSSKESRQSGQGKTTRDSSKRPKARSSQVGHRERSKSKSKRESHRHMNDRSNKSNSTRDLRETGDHQRSSRRHLSQSAGNLHSRDGERERSRSKSKSARLGGHRAISKSQSISHSYNDTERSRRRRSLEGGRRRKTISHAQSAEGGDKLSSKLVDGDKPTRAETSLEPVKRQDRRQRRTSLRDPVVKQRVSERMHRSVGILDFPGAFAEESNPAKDSKTKKKKAGMRRQVSDSTLVVADKTLKDEEPEDLVKLAKQNPKDRDKRVDVDDGVRRSAHGDSSHATTAGEGSQSTQQASNVGTLSKTSSRSRSGSAERTEKRLASHKAISQSKLTDGAKDESGEKQFTEAAKPTLEHAATHEVEGDAPKQEGSKTDRAERPKRRKSHQSIRPRSQSKEPSSRSRSTREHSRRSSATSGREKETTSRGKPSSTSQDRKTRRAGDSTRDTRSSVILSKRTSQRLRESQSERPARTIDKAIIVPSGHSSSSSERQDRRVSFDADTAEAAIANGAGLKGILKKNKVVAKRPRRDTRKVSAAPISQQSSANEHQTRT